MWVRIPALSHTTDTVIYMLYGSSSITTSQENKPGVWDRNSDAASHLRGGPSSTLPDSSSHAQTLTNSGGAPAAGKIGGAFNYDGNSFSTRANASVPVGAAP